MQPISRYFPPKEITHDYTRGGNQRGEHDCGIKDTVNDLFSIRDKWIGDCPFDDVFTSGKWGEFRHCLCVLCE